MVFLGFSLHLIYCMHYIICKFNVIIIWDYCYICHFGLFLFKHERFKIQLSLSTYVGIVISFNSLSCETMDCWCVVQNILFNTSI